MDVEEGNSNLDLPAFLNVISMINYQFEAKAFDSTQAVRESFMDSLFYAFFTRVNGFGHS
jgi:hypothetical protein